MTQDQEGREHQQMKEVLSLWQILLKKIVVQHTKNFLESREYKLRRKMQKNQPQLLVAEPFILHDHARPHKKLRDYGWEVLPHAPNSPYMSPPDFDLLTKLKEPTVRFLCFLRRNRGNLYATCPLALSARTPAHRRL